MKCYLLTIFIIFSSYWSFCQPQKIIFDHYGLNEGFTTRNCNNIVKTKDGLLWITSSDGLIRYDSKTFRFYKHNPTDSNSLVGNVTYNITTDNRGFIWVQSGSGLDIFNTATEQFSHCYILQNNKKKKDFWTRSIFYDSVLNRVWVGTDLGLYYSYNGDTQLQKAKTDNISYKFAALIFGAMIKDSKKNLWLGNSDGFFKYNSINGHITQYHTPNRNPLVENDDGITCMYIDNNETLWMGGWTKGLISYNINTGKSAYYYYSDHTKENNAVMAITQTLLSGKP